MKWGLGIVCLVLVSHGVGAEPAPFILGVNGHPFTQEGYWQVPIEQQMGLLKELGVGWYRSDWG